MFSDLEKIRKISPLVHNITNYVVMNNTANALLCIGASPIMTHAIEEVEEIVSISSSLVINIGTLSKHWIESMDCSMNKANSLKKPIVVDPVGAGASILRTSTSLNLINKNRPAIIRGNASEITALVVSGTKTKGVDSTINSDDVVSIAQKLSKDTGAVVVISGATDYICDGVKVESCKYGSPIMSSVTGLGCTSTAICGAFAAINNNYYQAACNATLLMGIAGQLTAKTAKGNGSFQVEFLDMLYNLNYEYFCNSGI